MEPCALKCQIVQIKRGIGKIFWKLNKWGSQNKWEGLELEKQLQSFVDGRNKSRFS